MYFCAVYLLLNVIEKFDLSTLYNDHDYSCVKAIGYSLKQFVSFRVKFAIIRAAVYWIVKRLW